MRLLTKKNDENLYSKIVKNPIGGGLRTDFKKLTQM